MTNTAPCTTSYISSPPSKKRGHCFAYKLHTLIYMYRCTLRAKYCNLTKSASFPQWGFRTITTLPDQSNNILTQCSAPKQKNGDKTGMAIGQEWESENRNIWKAIVVCWRTELWELEFCRALPWVQNSAVWSFLLAFYFIKFLAHMVAYICLEVCGWPTGG